MLNAQRAKVGAPVTVRHKPLQVGRVAFGSRPFKGVIMALEKRGRGAYVRRPRGGEYFALWEEMTARRAKEGER